MGGYFEIIGLIMGSNRFNLDHLAQFEERIVETKYGDVHLLFSEDIIILPRHGMFSDIPPHKINHRANMLAFSKLGVNKIISFTSVGSLKLELSPTEIILPDDYINLWNIPTYFDDKIRHIIPSIDEELRENVYNKIKTLPLDLRFKGVYIQTMGPRLESKAEINMLKEYGDVVGMTMASEATLAKEIGLQYANISVIDNYCNGIIDLPLTIETIEKNQKKNVLNIEKIIKQILRG